MTTVRNAAVLIANSLPSTTKEAHFYAELILRSPAVGLKAVAFASREVQDHAAQIVAESEHVDAVLNHDACPRDLKHFLKECLEAAGQTILS